MTSFGAILDANVLIMAGPRDTLLRAAAAGLYRPYWSEEILREVRRNLIDILTTRGNPNPTAAAEHLIDTIREEFPEALVEGYEALIPIRDTIEVCDHRLVVHPRIDDRKGCRWIASPREVETRQPESWPRASVAVPASGYAVTEGGKSVQSATDTAVRRPRERLAGAGPKRQIPPARC